MPSSPAFTISGPTGLQWTFNVSRERLLTLLKNHPPPASRRRRQLPAPLYFRSTCRMPCFVARFSSRALLSSSLTRPSPRVLPPSAILPFSNVDLIDARSLLWAACFPRSGTSRVRSNEIRAELGGSTDRSILLIRSAAAPTGDQCRLRHESTMTWSLSSTGEPRQPQRKRARRLPRIHPRTERRTVVEKPHHEFSKGRPPGWFRNVKSPGSVRQW